MGQKQDQLYIKYQVDMGNNFKFPCTVSIDSIEQGDLFRKTKLELLEQKQYPFKYENWKIVKGEGRHQTVEKVYDVTKRPRIPVKGTDGEHPNHQISH